MTIMLKAAFFYLFLVSSFALRQYPQKRLAGPPEEFAAHRIPDPKLTITDERSANLYIRFNKVNAQNGLIFNTTIPVDGPNEFVFMFASPVADSLRLELIDPAGKPVDLALMQRNDVFPIGTTTFLPVQTYSLKNTMQGFYTFNVFLDGMSVEYARSLAAASPYPNAVLTVINNDFLEIESHLPSYLIDVGDTLGVVSSMVNLQPGAGPNDIHVTHAVMDVFTPDGEDIEVEMKNDPAIVGNSPGFGAKIIADNPGEYLIQAKLEGWIEGTVSTPAVPFVRTTQHVISVSAAALSLVGTGRLRNEDANHVWIDINVELGKDVRQPEFRAYAEVWGVDAVTGIPKEACWIGGLSDLSVEPQAKFLTLELDLAWLQRAGVKGPLTLKNVYVSDIVTSFPIASYDKDIVVENSLGLPLEISPKIKEIPITRQMRVGVNPLEKKGISAPVSKNSSAAAPSLFLLAGYCASSNPWQSHANIFTDAQFYAAGGSLSNDEFAQKALSFISGHNSPSYSLIGHSQGGMVALHLHNYYFTEMENAKGGRLIQTVGTPWEGSSAAGTAAALGKIFGIGCGCNSDLSRDGAVNWLSGISMESRKEAHSYTTTYKQGNFFGDYCSLPMNIILQWPNDGTTEIKCAVLKGGVYVGNTEKQCHVSSMAYPPQTDDNSRNAVLNQMAAR